MSKDAALVRKYKKILADLRETEPETIPGCFKRQVGIMVMRDLISFRQDFIAWQNSDKRTGKKA